MRFLRLRAAAYGPHRDREFDLDAPVVLIFGRNESGKSSFRSAIETLLYGFEPASREKHPLAVWGEDDAAKLHLEAEFRLDAGATLRIERILQAKPTSRTAEVGADFAGPKQGNGALPLTGDVPRALYRSAYAIEMAQLAAFENNEQAHIDELLLPPAGSIGLRPIGEVRDALKVEIAALWRPRNQGHQRIRELVRELSEAHRRLRSAEEEEAELRAALREQGERTAKRDEDKRRKEELERIERDAPYLADLFDFHRHERAHGDPVDLSDLDDVYTLADPEIVEREAGVIEDELRAPAARLERDALVVGKAHEHVLEANAEIQTAKEAIRTHIEAGRAAETHAAEAERRLSEATRELDDVLAQPSDESHLSAVLQLPTARLDAALERWSSDWEAHATAPAPRSAYPPIWTFLVTALGGIVAIAATVPALPVWVPPLPLWVPPLPPLPPWAAPAATAFTLLGAITIFVVRPPPRTKGPPPARPETIDATLGDLPVAEGMLDGPTGLRRWIESVSRARELLTDAAASESESTRLRSEVARECAAWRVLCARLELASDGDGPVLVERLREALESAQAERERVRKDTAERQEAQTVIDAKLPALDRHRKHLDALARALQRNVPDATDPHAAYEVLVRRRSDEEYTRARRAELERDARWAAFRGDPRVIGDREPDDAPWSDTVARSRRETIAQLESQIEANSTRLGSLREQLGNDPGHRSARARDVVEELHEALENARFEHDRLALLESLLSEAERRFRKEHQPDVLRRASHYLERVTRGRYSRLDYIEDAEGGLFVTCRERSAPVKVAHPISRGTLDQIFLCLRLGLLDHLDADRERLPLILDDALLRIDDERRPEVYQLLREVATTRQVLYLTCHGAIADEAEKQLATTRIELGQE